MLLSFSFGKYTLKILPFPSLLSNSIYPLWISTNIFTSESPIPLPSFFLLNDLYNCLKNEEFEVHIDEELRVKAHKALENMHLLSV